MGNTENSIIINGKRYDAVTGAMLGDAPTGAAPVRTATHSPVVDGFVKRSKDVSTPHHSTVSFAKHHTHQLQKSKTLMRTAVRKPSDTLLQKKTSTEQQKKVFSPKVTVVPRTGTTPAHRQQLAQTVQKSTLVQKFGTASTSAKPSYAPLSVRPAPVAPPLQQKSKTSDLLERALQAAEGHKEQFNEPKKRLHHKIAKKIGVNARTIVVSLTILGGLLVGGLYAYQNVPNLAMRVAASRAGFKATLPDYNPSGFSFNGPVQYTNGQVTVGYKSNTDDRSYKLTQKTTDWSSESLLNNFILSSDKQYQTYQDKGRTIYIYDDNSATWVDGGIWYQIEGDSQLTTDQLIRIATSL